MQWIAALPMYNVAPALADDWRTLLDAVLTRVSPWLDARGDTVQIVDPGADLTAFWLRDDVLLSQTCGYPLLHALDERVQLVATPAFDAPGCERGGYRSVLVAGAHVGASSLEACRELHAVYNDDDSNSGMNLFRHAVAPFASNGRFFSAVTKSGGHLASLRALTVERSGDVAAIDCVTLAFVRAHRPELAAGIREIGFTASAPALPFIASKRVAQPIVDALAIALSDAVAEDGELAKRLMLRSMLRLPQADYACIDRYERESIELGYPRLA
ncbi:MULTISPECIES: PhnD/SsuA/transferrin family substrate-binding protein [unclassified Caballeronia]|uniref:phosphate/phosphite/phosphonate ABC transporter substrate-binding protein n=1 Tax=unclassified Caballeronia TaxID=2646786 RepID=UPI002861AC3C|nr:MULTISPECIES: PhnD/SsuA/transferrin family substrate-binding protein [unclassified Caballeronia]MDR5739644.1 PhnD/SsuA/transferrin family substrate-binding protein [Caballeronia sp. LZ016]MDR5808111.1 PhnD/SsuA/transferrin family substrate-binding protein [Caballeronia sp. LZ019]